MRKLIFIAVLTLAGCATTKRSELEIYTIQNKPLAGKSLKWSEFYERSHELATAEKLPKVALYGFQTQISLAKMYEGGKFATDDFEYRRQYIDSIIATSVQQQIDMEKMERLSFASAILQANTTRWATTANAVQANPRPQLPSYVGYGAIQGQSTSGGLKYCTYSNGVVTTIAATTICPVGSN